MSRSIGPAGAMHSSSRSGIPRSISAGDLGKRRPGVGFRHVRSLELVGDDLHFGRSSRECSRIGSVRVFDDPVCSHDQRGQVDAPEGTSVLSGPLHALE